MGVRKVVISIPCLDVLKLVKLIVDTELAQMTSEGQHPLECSILTMVEVDKDTPIVFRLTIIRLPPILQQHFPHISLVICGNEPSKIKYGIGKFSYTIFLIVHHSFFLFTITKYVHTW